MSDLLNPNRRILLIDDNPAIHEDFKRVLLHDDSNMKDLDAEAAALFGGAVEESAAEDELPFELVSAHQGEEALEKVKEANEAGNPFAMAFVDMRMPPGWDGLRTIEEIWKIDSTIQTVICTAYSDRSWSEIQKKLSARDRWMVVKKPFDQIEVLQLANALTKKWDLNRLAELRESTLEQMVVARTEMLSAALQTNSDFLDHASHEMLTPMNGIIGFIELLTDTPLNEEQSESLVEIRKCSERLLGLINQVLAFTEAGSKEDVPETRTIMDIREWLPVVVLNPLRDRAAEKGLELLVEIDPRYEGSLSLPANIIEKVLDILVENAIKFTQSGFVTLNVSQDSKNSSDMRISVSDTGLGLTPEQIELINIPFAQVDGSLARSSDGIGIGLPLARRLLKRIGSGLEIDSLPGEGTCVSFVVAEVGRRVAV